MPLTSLTDEAVCRFLFGNTAFSLPANWYIGLSTTTPSQTKGGSAPFWNFTEPSGHNYSRPTILNNTPNWTEYASSPADGWAQANGVTFTFPIASGSWGELIYGGVWDSPTGGNLIGYGELLTPVTITTGDQASYPPQTFVIWLN